MPLDPGAARTVDVPGKAPYQRQEAADTVSGLVLRIGAGGGETALVVFHAASPSGIGSSGRAGCGGASPPMTEMTSIGCEGGSSEIDMTRQFGARRRSSAASGRRARGWTIRAIDGAAGPRGTLEFWEEDFPELRA